MNLFQKLKRGLTPGSGANRKGGQAGPPEQDGRGIVVFEHTGDVIRAEKTLRGAGFEIAVKAPPPALRTGCDLVIEYQFVLEPGIRAALGRAGPPPLTPLQYCRVSGELPEPVSIFQCKDYGEHLMIRAANMKISVEKANRRIVNVSGGGCPDVPYLAALLVGKTLDEARPPLEQGQTLCGYALQLAFNEAKRIMACGIHKESNGLVNLRHSA